jgi:hypothetical protein
VEHEYHGDAPGDHDQQGDGKLSADRYPDVCISLQEPAAEGAGRHAGEHRKPAVGYGPGAFVYEKDQAAYAGQKRPAPGHHQCDGQSDLSDDRDDAHLHAIHSQNVRVGPKSA